MHGQQETSPDEGRGP